MPGLLETDKTDEWCECGIDCGFGVEDAIMQSPRMESLSVTEVDEDEEDVPELQSSITSSVIPPKSPFDVSGPPACVTISSNINSSDGCLSENGTEPGVPSFVNSIPNGTPRRPFKRSQSGGLCG